MRLPALVALHPAALYPWLPMASLDEAGYGKERGMQRRTDQREMERPTEARRQVHRPLEHAAGPPKGRREVELYVRTYMTLLESSGSVSVSSLEPAHLTAGSSLHAGAEEPEPDLNAFLYSANRIPASIIHVKHILLGQTINAFAQAGYPDVQSWAPVSAPARRRRWYWDGAETLAAYIASSSDLDDLIPSIVAYQFEWNKMSRLLRDKAPVRDALLASAGTPGDELREQVREAMLLSPEDWARLVGVWGDQLWPNLRLLAEARKRMDLRMLGGTYLGYGRSTRSWWRPVNDRFGQFDLRERPVYFVSSNTHSIVNTLSGVVRRRADDIMRFIEQTEHPELLPELRWYRGGTSRSPLENILYFAARSYFHGPGRAVERETRQREEEAMGITHLEPAGAVEAGIQMIELNKLDPEWFDPRLPKPDTRHSDALIVNINYPLGMAAFHIMTQVGLSLDHLKGVYILGKAATLNGRIGDIMMSNVVYDEHSGNTYWFDNCFGYDQVSPYLVFGAALDNQKAVTVKGTYLQNQGYLDFFYRENYTVVEMEAGPYLSALFEDVFLERHPADQAINLAPLREHFDLGIIHYASDTPYTRAHTLGARGLSFYGMDSTYASTIAILQRIFTLEAERLGERS